MATKRGKKLNGDILSIRDFKEGVEGTVGEVTLMKTQEGEPVLGKFGQQLATVELTDLATGEVRKFWMDGGLRGAFKMAKIQPGMNLAIVHTGEKEIDEGTVQTYDLFKLDTD